MRLLATQPNAQTTSLTDVLDALAVSHEPGQYLPALLGFGGRTAPANASGRAYLEVTTEGIPAPSFRIRRLLLPGQTVRFVDAGELPAKDKNTDNLMCEGGLLAELIKVPCPKIAHDLDLRGDAGLPPVLRRYRSAIALPMRAGSTAIEWVIVLDERADGFTPPELEEMLIRTRLVSITLENLQTAQRLCSANLRVKHDIDDMAALQRTLLPEGLPEVPGLRLAASYEAVSQAGGDIYDIFPLARRPGHEECLTDQRWAFLIGDVSGHGPAAAVVMAMLNAIVHAYPIAPQSPAEVLAHANRHLFAKRMQGAFVTALLAFYDPVTGKVVYSRAGHPPLVLTEWKPHISHRHLEEVGNLPLGIDPDQVFECDEFVLTPGQTMLLYTDGITEAQNQHGKLLDAEGLELAIAAGGGNAQRIVSSIQSTLEWHTRGTLPGDDRTILAIEAV